MATEGWTENACDWTTLGGWGPDHLGSPGAGDDVRIDQDDPGPSCGRPHGERDRVGIVRLDRPSAAKLSRRELDCLDLLVRGLSDRDMAARLAISEPTVRFHLDKARRKTGATSRTNLAALAIWLGLSRL